MLPRLRCNGHSLLLGSYLSRIGRIENPSCSACGHSSQDISHLILHCPATDSLRHSLSLYDFWSIPASGAPWSSTMPPSLGRGRVTNNNIIRSRTPLISFCIVQLRTLCASWSLQSLVQSGELPDFCGSVVFRHPPKGIG